MTQGESDPSAAISQVLLCYRLHETGPTTIGGDGYAQRIKAALEAHGYSASSSSDFGTGGSGRIESSLESSLAACSVVVAICSKGLGKDNVSYRELQLAESLHKPIIPIYHSGRFPPEEVEMYMNGMQRVPSGNRSVDECSWHEVVDELVERLENLGLYPLRWQAAVTAAMRVQSDAGAGHASFGPSSGHLPALPDVQELMQSLSIGPDDHGRFRRMVDSIRFRIHPYASAFEGSVSQSGAIAINSARRTSSGGGFGGPSAISTRRPSSMTSALSASFRRLGSDPTRIADVEGNRGVTRADMVHTLEGHTGALRTLAISPDGNTLYSGGEDKSIRMWSVGGGCYMLLHTVLDAHTGWIWSMMISPDGSLLYTGSGDKTIRIWAIGNASQPPRLAHTITGHEETVCSFAISKDGTRLYSGSDDKTIRVWDTSAGLSSPPAPLATLTGHQGYVSSLALSSDGNTLYSAGMEGDHTIRMWRVKGTSSAAAAPASPSGRASPAPSSPAGSSGFRQLCTLSAHTLGVYTITLSPSNRILYSGGEDKTIRIWAVDGHAGTGRLLRTVEGHNRWVRSVRLTPDGATLISGSADATMCLWSVDEGAGSAEQLQTLACHTDRVRCVRVSPDGHAMYSASADMTIRCWLLS